MTSMSEVEAEGREQYENFSSFLASEAKRLKVVVCQEPHSDEFMSTLSYRVDQAIVAGEERVAELKRLRDRYSA